MDENSSTPTNRTGGDTLNSNVIIVEFSPHLNYPTYPTYATEVINGVKYKVYLETDWNQVKTEDGVSLKELIKKLPAYDKPEYYNYKGYLRNSPKKTAMEKLLEIKDPGMLDVYLVEKDYVFEGAYVSEIYSWYGNVPGWVYMGSTNPTGTIRHSLPGVLNLIPEDLGEPNDFMLVTEDGRGICWANPLRDHNVSPDSHPDIRKLIEDIEISANKVLIFQDVLSVENWIYNPITEYYEYDYTNSKIFEQSYFEITPMIDDRETAEIIRKAEINPSYPIYFPESASPHAIIRATNPLEIDIPISVRVFGQISDAGDTLDS